MPAAAATAREPRPVPKCRPWALQHQRPARRQLRLLAQHAASGCCALARRGASPRATPARRSAAPLARCPRCAPLPRGASCGAPRETCMQSEHPHACTRALQRRTASLRSSAPVASRADVAALRPGRAIRRALWRPSRRTRLARWTTTLQQEGKWGMHGNGAHRQRVRDAARRRALQRRAARRALRCRGRDGMHDELHRFRRHRTRVSVEQNRRHEARLWA